MPHAHRLNPKAPVSLTSRKSVPLPPILPPSQIENGVQLVTPNWIIVHAQQHAIWKEQNVENVQLRAEKVGQTCPETGPEGGDEVGGVQEELHPE